MRCAIWALLGLAACVEMPVEDGPAAPLAEHETFVENPTEIVAESVRLLLPFSYADEVEVEGLSSGWEETPGGRRWAGTGACVLRLRLLIVQAKALDVSLVRDQPEPEVLLQAEGDVRLVHTVRGMGGVSEGLSFLFLRNASRSEW